MTYLTAQQLKDFPNYKPVGFEKYFSVIEIPESVSEFKVETESKFTVIYFDIFEGDLTKYMNNVLLDFAERTKPPSPLSRIDIRLYNIRIKNKSCNVDINFKGNKEDKSREYKESKKLNTISNFIYNRFKSFISNYTKNEYDMDVDDISNLLHKLKEEKNKLRLDRKITESLILVYKEKELIYKLTPDDMVEFKSENVANTERKNRTTFLSKRFTDFVDPENSINQGRTINKYKFLDIHGNYTLSSDIEKVILDNNREPESIVSIPKNNKDLNLNWCVKPFLYATSVLAFSMTAYQYYKSCLEE